VLSRRGDGSPHSLVPCLLSTRYTVLERIWPHLVPGRNIIHVNALPARQVAPQRQIHVLDCSPVVPAVDVLDAGAPPDAARAWPIQTATLKCWLLLPGIPPSR
jgi:hypothetical protein